MELTEKDLEIHAIADRLVSNNIKPTLSNVRKALGGGSFTTISDSMKIWKESQSKQRSMETIKESAPEALKNNALGLINEVWKVAQSIANERLNSERDALEEARVEYEEQAVQAAELADSIALELEDANKLIVNLNARIDELTLTNSDLTDENKKQADEISKLSKYAEETKANIEKISIENKGLYSENARLAGHIDDLEKEKKGNLEKIELLNENVGFLTSDLKNANKNEDKALKELDIARKELAERMKDEVASANTRNDSYNALISKIDALSNELDKTKRERDSFELELAELKNTK
jgi:DNA repair exonuclease SbcCD ATPase subunit